MKIQRIQTTNIKFGQNNVINKEVKPEQTKQQKDLSSIVTMPSQFIEVKKPISYTKIGEYEIFEGKKTHVYKLKNGQTIILTPAEGETKINTVINCGSSNEPDNLRGISHYIEHNLFNGSKDMPYGEFDKKMDKIGAYTNACTSNDFTQYYIQANLYNNNDLKNIIETHANMIQNPLFEQKMLDKEKGIVNNEIGMVNDIDKLTVHNVATKQLFQINSTSQDLVIGTVDNINSLSKQDVANYYNKNYTPDKMTTILTGDFELEKAIDIIAKNFTKQSKNILPQKHIELKPIEKSVRSDLYISNTDAAKFSLMMVGPKNSDLKDNLCIGLILDMFNLEYSKMQSDMKKYNSKILFAVDKIDNNSNSPQMISIIGDCKDKDTENVLKTIYENIFNFENNNLKEDLEIVKKQNKKGFLAVREDGNLINKYLSNYINDYKIDEICNIPKIINEITVNDIKNTFKKYFDLNKVSIAVAHPKIKNNKVSFKGNVKKQILNLNDFKYAKLPNNSDVYLKNDNSNLKSFKLTITTPQPAKINPILTSVLDYMLKTGSCYEKENDFNKSIEKNGIALSFSTNTDGIVVSGNALNEDINFALNKSIDVLNFPRLTIEDFEKAKKEVEQELNNTQPASLDYIEEVMFPQKKSASTIQEKKEALKKLQLGEIIGFLQYIKQNGQNKFIWNKNEVPYDLMKLGNFKQNNYQEFLTYKTLENDVLKVQIDDRQQAEVVQVYKFQQENTPKEKANIKILNCILGGMRSSRLFNDLREKQKLAYHTSSSVDKDGNTGMMILDIETTTDNPNDKNAKSENIQKSLDGFKKHTEKLKNEYVTDEELETAKKICKSRILNSMKTNADKMNVFLTNVIKGDCDFTNKLLDEIDKVDKESLMKTAQKVFGGYSMTSIVASEKTLKESGFVK